MKKLHYNYENDRFGIWDDISGEWENCGLHCGEYLQVKVDDLWQETRIEYGDCKGWYLVGVGLSGYSDLHGLPVRMRV